ncbi:MAG: hypothetical protein C4318_01370 [Acidimicrobiia bacterium]
MCGRFVQALQPQKIVDYFGVDPSSIAKAVLEPNFNVSPSQKILHVLANIERAHVEEGYSREQEWVERERGSRSTEGDYEVRIAERIRWGLVFPWAKSERSGPNPINARVESLTTKQTFRKIFLGQRSLVPADGFYEWRKVGSGRKIPYFIKSAADEPLAIGAIWSIWCPPDGGIPLRSCALITVPAPSELRDIHDRMPALVDPSNFDRWLDPEYSQAEVLLEMLRPTEAWMLEWYPVSPRVNNPSVNDPSLIVPEKGQSIASQRTTRTGQ